MSDILRDTKQYAKKHYHCDACETWLDTGYYQSDVSSDDWMIVTAAKADGWRILPGQQYRKVIYAENNTIKAYRARLDMDALCDRLDLFIED